MAHLGIILSNHSFHNWLQLVFSHFSAGAQIGLWPWLQCTEHRGIKSQAGFMFWLWIVVPIGGEKTIDVEWLRWCNCFSQSALNDLSDKSWVFYTNGPTNEVAVACCFLKRSKLCQRWAEYWANICLAKPPSTVPANAVYLAHLQKAAADQKMFASSSNTGCYLLYVFLICVIRCLHTLLLVPHQLLVCVSNSDRPGTQTETPAFTQQADHLLFFF